LLIQGLSPLPRLLFPVYRACCATGDGQISSRLGCLFRLRRGWVSDLLYLSEVLCKAVLEGRGFRPRRFWWISPMKSCRGIESVGGQERQHPISDAQGDKS